MRENLLDGWKILGEFREDIPDAQIGDDETFWYVCENAEGREVLIKQGGCPAKQQDLGDMHREEGRSIVLRHGGTWYPDEIDTEDDGVPLCVPCRRQGGIMAATAKYGEVQDGDRMVGGTPVCEECFEQLMDDDSTADPAGGDDPDEADMADAANSRLDDENDLP